MFVVDEDYVEVLIETATCSLQGSARWTCVSVTARGPETGPSSCTRGTQAPMTASRTWSVHTPVSRVLLLLETAVKSKRVYKIVTT